MKAFKKDPNDKSDWGNMTNEGMSCPACRKPLVQFAMRPLETLDEHISESFMSEDAKIPDKAAYQCPDSDCVTRKYGFFWNFLGDLYIEQGFPWTTGNAKANMFIDGNDAPFGSHQRQMNIEINKNDENCLLFTFPLWVPGALGGMKIYSNWSYESNLNGDILKRHFGLRYIHRKGHWYTFGIHMLNYSCKGLFKAWWTLRKNPQAAWHRQEITETIKREGWGKGEDGGWYRVWSAKLARLLLRFSPPDPKTVKTVKTVKTA